MRKFPTDEYDDKKFAREMAAPEWMLKQLILNPSCVSWGPYEDCMTEQQKGWMSAVERPTRGQGDGVYCLACRAVWQRRREVVIPGSHVTFSVLERREGAVQP